MQPNELVSRTRSSWVVQLLENYWEPWKQLVEYMKQGESTKQCQTSQGKVHKSRTEEDALEE
jgi:hypothetical protein